MNNSNSLVYKSLSLINKIESFLKLNENALISLSKDDDVNDLKIILNKLKNTQLGDLESDSIENINLWYSSLKSLEIYLNSNNLNNNAVIVKSDVLEELNNLNSDINSFKSKDDIYIDKLINSTNINKSYKWDIKLTLSNIKTLQEIDFYKKELKNVNNEIKKNKILKKLFWKSDTDNFTLIELKNSLSLKKDLKIKKNFLSKNIKLLSNKINRNKSSYTKSSKWYKYQLEGLIGFFRILWNIAMYTIFFYTLFYLLVLSLNKLSIIKININEEVYLYIVLIILFSILFRFVGSLFFLATSLILYILTVFLITLNI